MAADWRAVLPMAELTTRFVPKTARSKKVMLRVDGFGSFRLCQRVPDQQRVRSIEVVSFGSEPSSSRVLLNITTRPSEPPIRVSISPTNTQATPWFFIMQMEELLIYTINV